MSQLKLKSVYLMRNEDVPSNLETSSTNYNQSQSSIEYHQGRNVIDVYDLAANQSQLNLNSLRSIDMDTDYSLCANLPNNFSSQIDILNSIPDASIGSGKLTLNAVTIYGKGRGISMPPTRFGYNHSDSKIVDASISSINSSSNSYNIALATGKLCQNGNWRPINL
ncbi:MAG: hypothetical protein IPJ20_19555 [Flammeovirgaceae bacterium]|nr:hypothetical protein [Flammeovirgaceae bacterium]